MLSEGELQRADGAWGEIHLGHGKLENFHFSLSEQGQGDASEPL